ncbi:MAG TPA: enoyl-CoA hydratase-related protein [Desulfosporosinus sp.]|nr:enoyl-CoA hydratase-related protein [Desulfosporosinus sp.]
MLSKIKALNQPVIAAIHGLALGGGCEIALACDLRIASGNALLGLPEVSLGIIPSYGGTQRLLRLVGPSRAMALICTGDPIKADEGFPIGLVDQLAPVGQVLDEAKYIANKIMSRGPLAVQAAKKAILTGMDMAFEEGLIFEADIFASLCGTDDQKEGGDEFLSKRKPAFVGK